MTYPRRNHVCGTYMTKAGLELMVVQGIDGSTPAQTSEIFSFADNTWRLGTNNCPIVGGGTAIQFGMGFLVVGGYLTGGPANLVTNIYEYNPINDTWDARSEILAQPATRVLATTIIDRC